MSKLLTPNEIAKVMEETDNDDDELFALAIAQAQLDKIAQLDTNLRDAISLKINRTGKCSGCKYFGVGDCKWLKEDGAWCSGKTTEVADSILALSVREERESIYKVLCVKCQATLDGLAK